ncbi:MAG: complex I NDUFA9 subunit family protein [Thermoflexaceae bacterium]|nr:complex I NDUFA9 subunit family protein [Thermoflexaceae bacterium]
MKVCVAGGTGLLGRAIVPALINAGHEVAILSRSDPSRDPVDPRATWVRGDVTDPASLVSALRGMDAVVDAVQFPNSPVENPKKGYTFERIDLGGTKNLVDAAKAAGVPRFIGLSGAGAAEDARYHWLRFKWQEEQHIQASGLTWTIFRPSWIYGPRDVSLNRFLGFAKFLPFIPVIGNGKIRLNPLFVDDLAAHVAAAPGRPAAENRLFEIGGPDVLTMDEIIRTALRVRGKKRFLLHQPAALMKLVASVAQFAPGRPLTPDAIDFILMDPIADTASLREVFGLPLTPLAEALATYP